MPHKPKPSDLGSGAAAKSGEKIQTRQQKNEVAAIKAKKALGVPLSAQDKMKLAQFADGHQ